MCARFLVPSLLAADKGLRGLAFECMCDYLREAEKSKDWLRVKVGLLGGALAVLGIYLLEGGTSVLGLAIMSVGVSAGTFAICAFSPRT